MASLAYLLVPADLTLVKACLVVLVVLAALVLAMTSLHVYRHWNDCLCVEEAGCGEQGGGDSGPEGEPPGHPQAL